jgi:DNA-binding transcriptional regulator YdaS (Cro superfamily)
MTEAAELINDVAKLDPREAAERLIRFQQKQRGWLDAFAEHLDRRRSGESLARTLTVWGLSQSEAARLFGVSRQALSKWIEQGVPAERTEAVADLAAATDLLVHYLKRDRIPAVVRRAIPTLGGRSLIDLFESGDSRATLRACREMFSFANAHS